jgi:hypothetical protein
MKEKDLKEIYRSQVESRNVSPPESSWDDISTQLDLEDTWNSISMELNRVLPVNPEVKKISFRNNKAAFTRVISGISSIVLIILLVFSDGRTIIPISPEIPDMDIPLATFDESKPLQAGEKAKNNSAKKDAATDSISEIKLTRQFRKQETNFNSSVPLTVSKPELPVNNMNPTTTKETSDLNHEIGLVVVNTRSANNIPDSTDLKFFFPVVPAPPFQIPMELYPEIIMHSTSALRISGYGIAEDNTLNLKGNQPIDNNFKVNKFSVGISLTEKNTWLISQETFDGLDRQKLNATKAKFANDFGIILRYTQNEKWAFEGTGFILSKTGQSYRQYMNGIYSSKSYDLKYFTFELSSRYTLNKSVNINNFKSGLITGVYVSHLISAFERIDNSLFNISVNYDPVDYGVILGYELEIKLFNRMGVAPGFRIKYGIPNIFADKPGIPAELHSTRNASLEFRLNLVLPLLNY